MHRPIWGMTHGISRQERILVGIWLDGWIDPIDWIVPKTAKEGHDSSRTGTPPVRRSAKHIGMMHTKHRRIELN